MGLESKPPCLVVPNECMHQGISYIPDPVFQWMCDVIYEGARFMPRIQVEEDPRWRQIIPYMYVINEHDMKVLVYRRKGNHTEQRLADKWSAGFGGHIEPEDHAGIDAPDLIKVIRRCLNRELLEETNIQFPQTIQFVGLITDSRRDAPMVNRVHSGLVHRITINQKDVETIGVGDESQAVEWMTIPELLQKIKDPAYNWEDWTRFAAEAGMIF